MFLFYSGFMGRTALRVEVSEQDRQTLHELLGRGIKSVRVVLRALALLHLGEGLTAPQVSTSVKKLTAKAVRDICHRYKQSGLDGALYEKPRPGAAPLLDEADKQRIIAMVCSDPPEGRARWTVRLIAEEAVKRKLVARAGRETVRVLLQNHGLKPWRKKKLVCGGTQ